MKITQGRWTKFGNRNAAVIAALVIAYVVGLGIDQTAIAQTAPAGNEQPRATLPDDRQIENPMLSPAPFSGERDSIEEKHTFSERVDLSPLATLAAYTNSRVAIVDTVARDTIRTITGRGSYVDYLRNGDNPSSVTKLRYDPLFTFFDLMADPAYYLDKPIVHIEYLPLRKGILDQIYPNDEASRQRWLKLTRLTPMMILNERDYIAEHYQPDLTYARGLNQMNQSMNYLFEGYTRMNLIAPREGSDDWLHISSVPEISSLFRQLGSAWRARDVQTTNQLIRDIAAKVQSFHASNYPAGWRLQLERFYNGDSKYMVGYSSYFFAVILLLIAFGTGRTWLRHAGVAFLLAGLAIHATMFAARWVLAERIPIQNQFESMLGLCLGAVLFGTIAMFVRKQPIFGVAAGGIGFLTLMTAINTGIPGREIMREAAILNTSYILFYHVNIVLFSYGLIALGMIVSAVYLATYYFGSSEATAQIAAAGLGAGTHVDSAESGDTLMTGRQKLLNDLDKAQMTILQLAFWILGIGILLGAWWADHSWGRWWAFDPKETWALITWIIYLVVIHVRFTTSRRGLVTAWLSILGFLVMLWTYFGVNLLLPGLHAYA